MSETTLDTSQLNQLFHSYSQEELTSTERNGAAFANDVYNLTAYDGQKYVMRVLKDQLPETVQLEAAMQVRLATGGINTAHYLQLPNGSFVGEENDVHFTLSKHIDGETPTSASLGLVTDFGATLAKLHTCLDGLTVTPSKMQWFDPNNAQEDLNTYEGEYKDRLASLVGKNTQLFNLELPKSVIHGDLWLGNVFAEGNRVTAVFDMETAEYTYRMIDLARTYLSMRLETQYPAQDLVDKLIEGYNSSTPAPITQQERDSFGLTIAYASGVCATWHALHNTEYTEDYLGFGETAEQLT